MVVRTIDQGDYITGLEVRNHEVGYGRLMKQREVPFTQCSVLSAPHLDVNLILSHAKAIRDISDVQSASTLWRMGVVGIGYQLRSGGLLNTVVVTPDSIACACQG